MYMDVHVMVFVGFGFLMTFIKHNSWSAVGFTFLIACWALQITILCTGFWENVANQYIEKGEFHMISINLDYLILGDFGACAVLISFGAILGKCSLF
jgi:ammonium transporter Rh